MCLATSGMGLGALILPMIIQALVDHYGWRSALILHTGICMQCIPACMLFRPAKVETPEGSLKIENEFGRLTYH